MDTSFAWTLLVQTEVYSDPHRHQRRLDVWTRNCRDQVRHCQQGVADTVTSSRVDKEEVDTVSRPGGVVDVHAVQPTPIATSAACTGVPRS